MLKKGLKFISNRGNNIIIFNLSLMLLPAKVNLVIEKQNYKGDALVVCGTGCVEIILALLIKIVTLYAQGSIV